MSARFVLLFSLGVLAGASAPSRALGEPARERALLFADLDDDDDDGVRDGAAPLVSGKAKTDLLLFEQQRPVLDPGVAPLARWLADGRPLAAGTPPESARIALQGLSGGSLLVESGEQRLAVDVVEVIALDGRGARVDLAGSHAAISRVLPSFLEGHSARDPDALRWLFAGPLAALPERVTLVSERPAGEPLDRLERVPLAAAGCPPGVAPGLSCRATAFIRATGDAVDRAHPESRSRSLRAEVGGRIKVLAAGRKAASIRVGGPRVTALGPIERLRARLRLHVLRGMKGGMPAIGGDDAGALSLCRSEVDVASGLWGQCGIHFGPPSELEVTVRDPPPPHLLAIGCTLGQPASGGELVFLAEGRRIRVASEAGDSPVAIAGTVARALGAAGLEARVSVNPRIGPAALRTADVLVRRPGGELATLAPDGVRPISSDPSLGVCLGEVDLADGLEHFADADAAAGTIEERTLIKAYDDGDPGTIDVFIVPAFSGAGRIGESFVDEAGSSIQNAIVLDRAAIRAGARSYALAHELGHVLLDLPGHPDDYGIDQPSALMDADAADPSIFGPRRLSIEDCERALRQSGPGAGIELLKPWPMTRR